MKQIHEAGIGPESPEFKYQFSKEEAHIAAKWAIARIGIIRTLEEMARHFDEHSAKHSDEIATALRDTKHKIQIRLKSEK